MRDALMRLAPILELTRVTRAVACIANIWFVILWTRAHGDLEAATAVFGQRSTAWLLTGGTTLAIGLFAFAASLNDVLDLKRDRHLKPNRPLPSGRLSLDAAMVLVVCTLLVALLGSAMLGIEAVVLCVLLAGAILAYNAVGKFIPAVGLVLLGLIYAGHMAVPNIHQRFVWPLWLVMTHSLVVAGVVHRLSRKVPRLSQRAMLVAGTGWVFWSGVILFFGWSRNRDAGGLWPDWVSPQAILGPAVLIVLFIIFAWRRVAKARPGTRAAEKIDRYGSLWVSMYAWAWMFGTGHHTEGIILASLTAGGFLMMTILRELYSLAETPMGYRR